MSNDNVAAAPADDSDKIVENEVDQEINALLPDSADDDEVEVVESDGRKTRVKKLVFTVPEDKLSYPFPEGVEPWTDSYCKLKDSDFKTEEEFKTWESEVFLQAKLDKYLQEYHDKCGPVLALQKAIKLELEESKRIADSLHVSDPAARKALTDALKMMQAASGAGLSLENLQEAASMLFSAADDE